MDSHTSACGDRAQAACATAATSAPAARRRAANGRGARGRGRVGRGRDHVQDETPALQHQQDGERAAYPAQQEVQASSDNVQNYRRLAREVSG